MNITRHATLDELARLFAARKDTLDCHMLWLSDSGEVHLDPMSPCSQEDEFRDTHPQLRACVKMFRRGQGYVGKKAAADNAYLESVLRELQIRWQQSQGRGSRVA
ncbi:hypothetical protein EGJ27_19195 [Pseudomonas sp. v388]|uniref:hypothetical protein n=1 Tax=Pseudomonas sp. v388 TaxID=2479849 RepID=UPI000F78A57E|nr:hypothetical protein [Pseudomonas sp. v388]RRV05294.1 hypothetical protein EGJ27_19195 [Pseudomonas sp. v388]